MTEQNYTEIVVPREGVNDDSVRVVEWLLADGAIVKAGQAVAVLETTKSTFNLNASADGHLFQLASSGADVTVGTAIALVAQTPHRPELRQPAATHQPRAASQQAISKKARALIDQHGLDMSYFAGLVAVREADVDAVLRKLQGREAAVPARIFRGERLDPGAEWDAVLASETYQKLQHLSSEMRKRMKAKFNRHVPMGTLLNDRWELAREQNFGEDTSVYDECLILGDVKLGSHCWVGPFTILDGLNGPLVIGDYVDIGSGSHVYTHNTIERALTGHRAPLFGKGTTIGNCCFIAPNSVIAPGTIIGDHCFIAAGSYVEGAFPSFSYISGNPAKIIGRVEISGNRARIRPYSDEQSPTLQPSPQT